MNNPTIDNDLQKAIDDITKVTNDDPIFADPVAAAPAVTEELQVPTRPAQTITYSAMPQIPEAPNSPKMPAVPAMAPVAPAPAPEVPAPAAVEPAPTLDFTQPPIVEETTVEESIITEPTIQEPVIEPIETPVVEKTAEPFISDTEESLDATQVKEAALRDLAPIVGKLDLAPEKKFSVYKKVIENYNDPSVFGLAYHAAGEIENEKERAEALLYLVESIDNL
ncbi:MAG: hypothetical protein Q4B29_01315 [Candidatus Saccharibacteria bacterium]|nr:hypothetical protein [Candidatus Saccharibacteria bacterium]